MPRSNISTQPARDAAAPRRQLSLADATAIIVGIIIGAGIYEATPLIARCVPNPTMLIGVWLLGGLTATVGALCYAELVGIFPHEGGDYVYLSRAYGKKMGFVFAWSELWVIRPGSIGAVAYVFARYANELLPLGIAHPLVVYAAGAILVLSIVNILGVRESKWTQNLLTAAKVVGMLVIFVAAWTVAAPPAASLQAAAGTDYKLAMILVLYTYGGWSEVAYVAAEVHDAKRNILKALLVGLGLVIAIYVLANLSFAHALGFDGLQQSNAVATEVLGRVGAARAGHIVAALICISTLGAINGQIFTGSRIYYALGAEQPLYARLGRWSPRFGTPVAAIVLQTLATLIPVVAFGLKADSFSRMVVFTAPAFWFFFLLVGISLFVLRQVAAGESRSFRVPFYPWTPIAFCTSSLFMLYSSLAYALEHKAGEALWSIIILGLGYLLSFYEPAAPGGRKRRRDRKGRKK